MQKKLLLLLGAGLGLISAVFGQAPAQAPPVFTWAAAYSVVPGPAGINTVGYAAATVTATGDVWINVPDSVITHLYGGLARQRLERRRPDGTLAFRRYLTGRSLIYHLRAAANGRLYLAGYYEQSLMLDAATTLTTADPTAHAFLACLDSTGAVLYARDLTATTSQDYGATRALEPAPNDHLYLGVARSFIGQPNTYIHELDAQGSIVRTLTQTGGMSVTSLALDAQNALFVTGTCVRAAGGSFNGTTLAPGVSGNGYNQYVACYEPSGTLRWARFMGDVTCVDPQVRPDGAGGVYWLTSLTDAATFGGVTMAGPASGGTEDYLLARLDAAGTPLWVHDVATTQADDAGMGRSPFSLDTDAAGNLYLAGQTRGTIQWAPGVQTTAGATRDLLVQRIAPTGVVEWARTAAGAQGYVYGSTLAVAPDGSVVVTGVGSGAMTFDALTLPTVSRTHHFVARLTPATTPTSLADARAALVWHLIPNPTTAQVVVQPPANAGFARAELFDALGRRVAQATGDAALSFDLRALPAGLYVVRITSPRGTWGGRVVKE